MDALSEEGDNLNDNRIIKQDSQNQQKKQSKSGITKIAVITLMICAIILTIRAIIRENILSQCQQNLKKVTMQSTQVLKKIDLAKQQSSEQAANPAPPQPAPINSKQNIQPIIKQKIIIIQPQYQIDPESLNLWLLPPEQKKLLLSKVQKKDIEELDQSPFLRNKDEQAQNFFKQYEDQSELINWAKWEINKQQNEEMSKAVNETLVERANKLDQLIGTYNRKYGGKSGFMPDQNHGITYQQFFQTLQFKKITGSSVFSTSPKQEIKELEESQRKYYDNKYNISKYKQLPVCIIVPTYNNIQDLRYAWNIESLLQQQYSNYRAIIIDDNSKDNTVNATGLYLKWRGADPSKFILIEGKKRRTALENIYYGVHKYCDYGQVFMIFDGDDELFGRQVLKVINSLYQKHKYYLIYSQFISHNPPNKLEIGLSEDFPYFVKERNSYRTFKHSYSQLRTLISDLILLVPMANLKLKNGNFFGILYDNALFYPAFQMSCRNFFYLPEIFYWYNINTGSNDWKKAKTMFYRQNRFGIQLQKPFRCIDEALKETKARELI